MFSIRVLEIYLNKKDVRGDDRETILSRAKELAGEGNILTGPTIPELFRGYPKLRAGLTNDMFLEIAFEDPTVIDDLR